MVFKERREKYSTTTYHVGRKGGFSCEISWGYNGWYVLVLHTKKDITFNTLWVDMEFESLEKAQAWCEKFNYKDHECLGKDK